MQYVLNILLVIHVIAGALALIFGALAITLKNKTPKHKKVGKLYFWCMTIVFISSVILSVAKGLLFLFFIAVFTYYATLIAYRSLKLKELHLNQKPTKFDWIVEYTALSVFIGLLLFAIWYFFKTQSSQAVIPLSFGLMGLLGVLKNIKQLKQQPKEKLYWLKKHIGNMLGSYIGAITAFLVNQGEYIPVNPIILWLGPTVILVPLIVVELKKVKTIPIN